MKMSNLDRFLLLLTVVLAGYQISIGINKMSTFPIYAYTIGFGVLLVAGLLLIILGYEALDSPIVVIVSTIIPLSLSVGLVWELQVQFRFPYLVFAILGFLATAITRLLPLKNLLPLAVLTFVHAGSGLLIFILPVLRALTGLAAPGFALVGLGGALIGLGGIQLMMLRAGQPLISPAFIFKSLPGLLLLMTAAFVAGFSFS